MQELKPERAAIKAALAELHIEAFVFEADAGARPQSIQETYLEEIDAADLYIGVFWKGYGVHTVEEFEHACLLGMDCLIYEKRHELAAGRAPELQAFLDRLGDVEEGLTMRRLEPSDNLHDCVKGDVAAWLARVVRDARPAAGRAIWRGIPSRPPLDFVGRAPDVDHALRELRAGRDLAIEGLAGVGKTTLAVVLAHHPGIRRRFRDGVLWASLGSRADPAPSLTEWANALSSAGILKEDIADVGDVDRLGQTLRDAIGEREMLLVIDDAWDLETARALRCGGLRCCHLVTTRDKGVARGFAGSKGATPLPTLSEEAALELLRRLAPEAFESDPAAASSLVRAVGGLPQAVRLVGGYLARADAAMFGDVFADTGGFVDLTDPRARLQLAERRLGARDARQSTLAETIALSLETLPAAATAAFHALGAFAAKPERFSPESAGAITEAEGRILSLLAARNLIEVDRLSRRLSLHPVVADVARTELEPGAIDRHREHYLRELRESGGDPSRLPEIYGQLRWAWQQAPNDETLFPILGAVQRFQRTRGFASEMRLWGERALGVAEARGLTPAVARSRMIIGDACRVMGRLADAVDCYQRALEIWQSLEDPCFRPLEIETRELLAGALAKLGQPEQGLDQVDQALALAAASGDRHAQASGFLGRAYLLQEYFDPAKSVDWIERALQIFRERGDKADEADALRVLGSVHRGLDQLEPALECLRQAMRIQEEMEGPGSAITDRMLIATVYRRQGRIEEALPIVKDARAKVESSGDAALQAECLSLLADLHREAGRHGEALACLDEQLTLAERAGLRRRKASVLEDIAALREQQGRCQDALDDKRRALSIYRELGDLGGEAGALEGLNLTYWRLGEPEQALACAEEALAIWQTLGNRLGQARALRGIAFVRLERDETDAALATYRQSVDRCAALDDPAAQAAMLAGLALAHEKIASQLEPRPSSPGVTSEGRRTAAGWERCRIEHLEEALGALAEATRLAPASTSYSDRLDSLRRKHRHAQRFGAKILNLPPAETPVALTLGRELLPQADQAIDEPRRDLERRLDEVCRRVELRMGFLPASPWIQRARSQDFPPAAYLVELNEVQLVTAQLPPDERLYPGPLSELDAIGVPASPAVNPVDGQSAAWVGRAHWAAVEKSGRYLWEPLEYLDAHLESVYRHHLAELIGHQETMSMLEATLPQIATRMHQEPAELAVLVLVLRNLLEELVPIRPFRRIVETVIERRRGGADRLAVLGHIRLLPEVRPLLPGNDGTYPLWALDPTIEAQLRAGVQTVDNIPYIALDPEETMRILALVRQRADSHPAQHGMAIVVADGEIRRFVRKLMELELPHVPVLSRDELLPGMVSNIAGRIESVSSPAEASSS